MSSNNEGVWVLEELVNAYDQRGVYTRCIWKEKPKIEILASYIDMKFPSDNNEEIVLVVNLWQGKDIKISNSSWVLYHRKFGEKG